MTLIVRDIGQATQVPCELQYMRSEIKSKLSPFILHTFCRHDFCDKLLGVVVDVKHANTDSVPPAKRGHVVDDRTIACRSARLQHEVIAPSNNRREELHPRNWPESARQLWKDPTAGTAEQTSFS